MRRKKLPAEAPFSRDPGELAPPDGILAQDPAESNQFLITALGASAGGLEALEKFFDNMPADADIAFVVVMHLSPDHPSALPELLARCTEMAVEQVQDNTNVVPNRVYIIPPNATLTIEDCTLHISAPVEARGSRTAIDSLFRSLAEDQGENAVCIILSGTGTDGTLGLRAVKEHGGMAMAQTLESAKYDAILRSAIATGLVDHVLPVEEMPAKLAEYAAHLHSLNGQPNDIRQQIEKHSNKIHGLLRRRVGHDFSQYRDGTIVRRLERRMKALQIETVEQYVQALERQPEEADLLFKDLLIGVTGFFRDPHAFEALSRDVIPKLFQRREGGTQLRVCVVGCATGEEAYSIAILLCEHASTLDSPPEIKIFATDIDERALETARKGYYPEAIAEHVSTERLDRFFIKKDSAYQVKRELRELCLFSSHSFIKDPPFSRLDLISCRNVMIYLGENLQRKVVPLFHYALRSGGYLFLGPSESVTSFRDLFSSVDKKHRIFQKKDTLPRSPVAFPFTAISRTKHSAGTPPEEERSLPKRLERIILKRYAPACVIVNESGDAVYFSGRISPYLEQPTGSPDTNVLNMAREGLRIPLRTVLHRVATTRERVVQKQVSIQVDGATSYVDLTIEALSELQDANLYAVTIAEAPLDSGPQTGDAFARDGSSEEIVRHLEGELQYARDHAQTIFEELESTNEELRSANEEYQSTNEELETSKEELQSFNEELETVNTELNRKVTELDAANSDLQNFLNSTQIATIFLDSELNIRNFTPAAGTLFRLIGSDVGRPITDLAAQFTDVHLVEDARQVLATLSPRERQVDGAGGRFFQRRILPYRTVHSVISGVILTLVEVTELRQAEQRAQQERVYAESIVDTVREPLVVLNRRLHVTSASKAFYDTFHVSADETLAKSVFDLGDRQWDIPGLRELLTGVLPKNQKVDDYEVEHDFPNLGRRTMLLNGRRLVQGDGTEPLLLLAIEDITERKRAEDVIRESERRRREIIEALPTPVYTTDANGRIAIFNQAAVEFFGGVPQPGTDSWCVSWKLFRPDGTPLPHDQSPMAVALRENQPIRGYEAIAERPDGTFLNFVAYPTPLHDESGKLTGAVNMLVDVTDRKKIEDKLRENEEQLRSMFEQTKSGIVQTDLTGRFLMVNDGFCQMVARSREELMNLRMQDITHQEDLSASVAQFTALAEGRSSNFEIEKRYVRPDGSHVWAQAHVSAICDDQGRIRYMGATVADISDRKRIEQERRNLEERERAVAVTTALREMEVELARVTRALTVGELATSIAHEVNQPLAGIVTNAEACLRWLGGKEPNLREAQESLTLIVRDGNRASEVIRRIREFLRKDSQQITALKINSVAQDTVALARAELLKRNVGLRVELEDDLPLVRGDRIQLQQVILNMIMNGSEAMYSVPDRSRELVLTSRKSGTDSVLLAVRDSGAGINPQHMDRMFDAFFTTKPEGMGMGLSISRSIIEAHGGRIWVVPNEGAGLTIQFTLPVESEIPA